MSSWLNLTRAEVSRFFARRFIRVMMVFIVAIFALIAIGYAANTAKIDDSVRASAVAQAQAQIDAQTAQMEAEYQRCVDAKNGGDTEPQYQGMTCEDFRLKMGAGGFDVNSYAESFLPRQFHFVREVGSTLFLAAAILCLFAFVVGASFVGAEWTSGGLTNLLLWQPRRMRVLSTKLGTGLAGIAVIGAGYLTIWVLTLWTIASVAGSTVGATPGFWRSLVLLNLRVIVLALAAAAMGFALASLGRHTAMALGVFIGYLLVFEVGTRIVFGTLNVAFPERFTLVPYVVGWLLTKYTTYDYDVCRFSFDRCEPREYVFSLGNSAWVIGLLAAALVGAALLAFRRRDVA